MREPDNETWYHDSLRQKNLTKNLLCRNAHKPDRFTPGQSKSANNYFNRLDPPRGAPSGAAAFIIFFGSQPPSAIPEGQFLWETSFMRYYRPPLRQPCPAGGGGACDASELPAHKFYTIVYM
jgi:hypothetical protein